MLKNFDFEQHAVRVVSSEDGEPWFVASDVLAALTLDRKALERLDDDEKGVNTIHTPGGKQDMVLVSEAGLYTLIFTSRKDEAKRFRRWVMHEVLPAIRRTGAYAIQAPAANPPAAISPTKAARLYCDTFAMARQSGMSPEACHQLAAQTKYEASGWWWQFKEVPKGALLAGPGKPLQICTN